MAKEGLVSRSFPLLLMIALAAGGWYVLNHPGAASQLGQFLPQTGGQSDLPGYLPSSPNAQATAQYTNFGRPATPSPMLGGPTIRIASFNIQVFGDAKGAKPYIMQALAAIIQNFHIVAIQEIRTQDDY